MAQNSDGFACAKWEEKAVDGAQGVGTAGWGWDGRRLSGLGKLIRLLGRGHGQFRVTELVRQATTEVVGKRQADNKEWFATRDETRQV
ncbi:hypothetical protein SAMD00023353_1901620 [Rosellinia necatrix]|uniref:Uncharacterized protein n=1 Tax=Rosellinia necatrix TaxID=77044 RepID=A0A1S8A7H2_ROSNE|nr:hypothetical protein SAMD00023353_1901620 [Rosellinia necatrix]